MHSRKTEGELIEPDDLLREGIEAAQRKDFESARDRLDRVLSANPSHAVACQWRGLVSSTGVEALRFLERAVVLAPDNCVAKQNLQRLRERIAATGKTNCLVCSRPCTASSPCSNCGCITDMTQLAVMVENSNVQRSKVEELLRAGAISAAESRAVAYLNLNESERALDCLRSKIKSLSSLYDGIGRATDDADMDPAPSATPESEAASSIQPTSPPCVLLVDDSSTVRHVVMSTLERRGYEVVSATTGEEACELVIDLLPDLVLLDIGLPGRDGYSVCEFIKGQPELSDVPVVMLSGREGAADMARGERVGSVDYITKPFNPQDLLDVVARFCDQKDESAV